MKTVQYNNLLYVKKEKEPRNSYQKIIKSYRNEIRVEEKQLPHYLTYQRGSCDFLRGKEKCINRLFYPTPTSETKQIEQPKGEGHTDFRTTLIIKNN